MKCRKQCFKACGNTWNYIGAKGLRRNGVNMNEVKKITKSTIIYLFGSVLSKLVAFFMLRVYTSYISPADFGQYDLSITYSTLVSSIVFLDIWCGIMRFMFDYKEKDEKYSVIYSGGVIFGGSTLVYTIIFFALAFIMKLDYKGYVFAYGLSLSFQNLFGYTSRAFGYNLRFAISGLVSTIVNASLNIVFIVFFGMGYESLYISYVTGILVQCIILEQKIHIIPKIHKYIVNWGITKNLFRFSLPLSINSASYWLLTNYGTVFISERLGTKYNGYYAVASKFSVMITLVSVAFSMAWQEMAFSKTNRDSETGAFYSKATDVYIKLLFCGCIGLIPFIYIIFPYFVAASYTKARTIIPIYILATVLSIFSTFLGNILAAYKRTKTVFTSTLAACIVNIIVLYLFINKMGLAAAPTALFFGYLVNCSMRIMLIKKIISYKFYLKKFMYIIPVTFVTAFLFQKGALLTNGLMFLSAIFISFAIFGKYIIKFLNRFILKKE